MRWFSLVLLVAFLSIGCKRSVPDRVMSEGTSAAEIDAEWTVEDKVEPVVESEPSNDNPAVWSVTLDQDQANPGDTVTLTVKCDIHPDWHIYAVKGRTGVARPTRLDLRLPKCLTMDSEWRLPSDTTVIGYNGPESHYTDESVFSATLKVDENASAESATLWCEVHYQACKDVACLPPTSEVFELPFVILAAKEP